MGCCLQLSATLLVYRATLCRSRHPHDVRRVYFVGCFWYGRQKALCLGYWVKIPSQPPPFPFSGLYFSWGDSWLTFTFWKLWPGWDRWGTGQRISAARYSAYCHHSASWAYWASRRSRHPPFPIGHYCGKVGGRLEADPERHHQWVSRHIGKQCVRKASLLIIATLLRKVN